MKDKLKDEETNIVKGSAGIIYIRNADDLFKALDDNVDRRKIQCYELDLYGDKTITWRAELSGIDLSGINFKNANLMNANLMYANLGRTNQEGAYLDNANLMYANLWGAIIKKSALTYAVIDQNTILPNNFLNEDDENGY